MTIIDVSLSSKLLKRIPVFLLMLPQPALLVGQTYWLCKAESGGRGRGKGPGAFRGGGEWVGGLYWGGEEEIIIKEKNGLVIHWLLKGGGLHDNVTASGNWAGGAEWRWCSFLVECGSLWAAGPHLLAFLQKAVLPERPGRAALRSACGTPALHKRLRQGLMPVWLFGPIHTQAVTEPRGHFQRVNSNFLSLKETLLLFFIPTQGRKTLPKEFYLLRRKEDKSCCQEEREGELSWADRPCMKHGISGSADGGERSSRSLCTLLCGRSRKQTEWPR